MAEKVLNLAIAELIATTEPVVISTILGSCVSVCLHCPRSKAGGMIHYALPDPPPGGGDEPLRYGRTALTTLVQELESLTGHHRSQFVAKVVGGANTDDSQKPHAQVGDANIRLAETLLKHFGIPMIGKDVGGSAGRKVLFHVATGRLQSAPLEGEKKKPAALRPNGANGLGQHPPTAGDSPPSKAPPSASPRTTPAPVAAPVPNLIAFDAAPSRKTRVLIVDDSPTIRELLTRILSQDPELEVVGQAEDPFQAEAQLINTKPDVITLDVHMPGMTGVQWLEKLLPRRPMPVVMITSLQLQDGNEVFHALELGAVDYIQKPALKEITEVSPIIRTKVKEAAKAKVRYRPPRPVQNAYVGKSMHFQDGLVLAIGASTGGTEALREVLIRMPPKIPPTVIVQHIPPVFSKAFADRLNSLCPFEVKEAQSGDAVHEDRVLIAPGGTQMKVVRKTSGLFVEVNDEGPVNRHKPSVDYLFNSVASIIGKKAIGVILTGMGADGAKGLLNMKASGARTLTQDEASCVVYGMPKAAWEIGASDEAVTLEKIASRIVDLASLKKVA